MSTKELPLKTYFATPLWKDNQILAAILGICSALAVTVSIKQAITMALAVTFVTGSSSFVVSLVRKVTPGSVRMIAQLAIISTLVTIVDQFLKAYMFEMSKTMSIFVALIITNCLVMGRAEAMAKNVSPISAMVDGLGAGLGYGWVIVTVAFIREFMGFGTLFGYQVIPEAWYATAANPDAYQNFNLMVLPPGAFFILGGMIWIAKLINKEEA